MIHVAVLVVYDLPGWYEEEVVSFPLSAAYGCNTPEQAKQLVLDVLAASDPALILDDEDEVWDFYRETVRYVIAWTREST